MRDLTEFMWVAVARWEDDRVHGSLANDSGYDPKLRTGSSVAFAAAEATDWMLRRADGGTEGGYSVKALAQ